MAKFVKCFVFPHKSPSEFSSRHSSSHVHRGGLLDSSMKPRHRSFFWLSASLVTFMQISTDSLNAEVALMSNTGERTSLREMISLNIGSGDCTINWRPSLEEETVSCGTIGSMEPSFLQ